MVEMIADTRKSPGADVLRKEDASRQERGVFIVHMVMTISIFTLKQ